MVVSSTTRESETPVRLTRTHLVELGTEPVSSVRVPADTLCKTSLELVLNEPGGDESLDNLDEPLATLYEEGGHCRALLARVTVGQGCVLEYVILRIQKNSYSIDNAPGASLVANNIDVENLWLREYDNLRTLSISTNAVPHLIDLSSNADSEARLTKWPPLLLCKKQRRLFSTICSRCGHVLSDCRDDALLIEHGLPTYAASIHRFLYCRQCVEQGREPRFYAYALPEGLPAGQVGSWEDLCSDIAHVLQERERIAAQDPELDTLFSNSLPCYTCTESVCCREDDSGDTVGSALKDQLVPASFYETFVICSDLVHFHYDEFSDLLGGQPMDELREKFALHEKDRGQALRLVTAERMIRDRDMLLFEADGSGLDALEIFRLKLSMFAQLCQGLYEFHRRCRQPHLSIEPRSVLVKLAELGEHLPTMWNFQVKLSRLSSTAPLTIEGKPSTELYFPPVGSSIIYTAPIIRQGLFGRRQIGDFVLTDVAGIGDSEDQDRVKLKGELSSENIFSQILSRKDLVYVVLPGSSFGMDDLVLWCHQTEASSATKSSLSLQSEPCRLKTEIIQRMKDTRGIRIPNVRYALYPCFHVPCDLHSLGMMLFRTVLVNDQQELAQVEMALDGVRNQLPNIFAEPFDRDDRRILDIIRTELCKKENADVFDKRNVFYRHVDRLEGRPNAIPDTLWYDTLLLGLRLVTSHKSLGICADHGDFDSRYPAEKLEQVLEALDGLVRKVNGILFSRSKHSVEVRGVIDEVVAEPFNGPATASESRM